MTVGVLSWESVPVPPQNTRFRRISTPIPAPGSAKMRDDLERYESRSMHGQLPIIWDRAEGFQVFDPQGNCFIDFTSTIFVANAGHGHPHIREALRHMLDVPLLHTYTFASDIRRRYLKALVEMTPTSLEKVFLLSAGTEATECALKLMRLHGLSAGKRRNGVVSFEGAMHGRTLGAVMMGGNPGSRAWVGYEDPNIHRLSFPYPWTADGLTGAERARRDLASLEAKGLDLSKDVAGVLIESYQGWGAIFYPPDYVQELASYAKSNAVILAFDEIQSGFGRSGKLFAYEHYGVEADLVCVGKGMSSSLPLAGVLGRATIMDLPDVGSMSSTHSANPLVSAAGLANLEIIKSENLVAEADRKGRILHDRLEGMRQRFKGRISHVLGKGMVAAALIVDRNGVADGPTATDVCLRCMRKGLLLVHTGRESIKMGPPLTIPDDALNEGLDVLEASIAEAIGV